MYLVSLIILALTRVCRLLPFKLSLVMAFLNDVVLYPSLDCPFPSLLFYYYYWNPSSTFLLGNHTNVGIFALVSQPQHRIRLDCMFDIDSLHNHETLLYKHSSYGTVIRCLWTDTPQDIYDNGCFGHGIRLDRTCLVDIRWNQLVEC